VEGPVKVRGIARIKAKSRHAIKRPAPLFELCLLAFVSYI